MHVTPRPGGHFEHFYKRHRIRNRCKKTSPTTASLLEPHSSFRANACLPGFLSQHYVGLVLHCLCG
ncbi:hypothetical protein IscW_ISCW024517 [Ixodes scapularis]|uniref:Uncharacterized protein n=1 Tax=Ixodes scapularis TaxID=6945 RepID=B7Q014_IXOSC|nr:hypothetical protein IscW_ISCW024517 [Ixodes scapularis]|eukprot:XP_002406702.1 hypothetical protein IscW_ISCW024517 [Ixodes scapularis]